MLQAAMEVYVSETREIIRRFLNYTLSFPECIAALDAALAKLLPRLTGDQIPRLRAVMMANNAAVTKEMERRGSLDKKPKKPIPPPIVH